MTDDGRGSDDRREGDECPAGTAADRERPRSAGADGRTQSDDGRAQTDGGLARGDAAVVASRRALVAGSSSWLQRVAAGVAGLSVLAVLVGLAVLATLVSPTATALGLTVTTLLGAAMAATGAGVLALGAASRAGRVETRPDPTVGLGVGVGYGLVGAAVGALVGTATLGLPAAGWLPLALLSGVAWAAVAALPREDVGATVPPGALGLTAGLLVLGGRLGPGVRWTPEVFSIVVPGGMAVALTALAVGLLSAWTAARAYGGFGTHGKQAGAYLLIGANAAWMLGLLCVVVGFVVANGLAPVLEGIRVGLFTRPVFWFYLPPIEEYVILEAPGLWFFWPFAMNGASLTVEVRGVMPAIVGTVWLVVGAVALAVPLGVGAAVFLTEYAEGSRFSRVVEISTNGLWSTPSIVYGLFGFAFLVPRFGNSSSILAGQFVLGFMLLPLVLITSREALKAVPDEYRDASAALGVSKWQTVRSVVLPAAMPGVITGVILGVGRIAGETAPILLVTGGDPFPADGPGVLGSFELSFAVTGQFPFVHAGISNPALLQPASALPYQLFAVITAGVGENLAFAWGTALMLLGVVLGFYAVGIASRIYFRRKLQA